MTDSTQNYHFDFETEAKNFADFIGTRADKVVYVDVGIDKQRGRVSADKVLTGDQQLAAVVDQTMSSDLRIFAQQPGFSSFCKPVMVRGRDGRPQLLGSVLYFNQHQFATPLFGTKDQDMQLLFTLCHESTHAIAQWETPSPNNAHPENIADALAALLLLKRFGQDAVPFLQNLSLGRANMALQAPTSATHLTSVMLDNIIADSQHEDFSKLSADQVMQRAQDYSAKWMPDDAAVQTIKQVAAEVAHSKGVTPDLTSWLMSTTSLSGYAPSNVALYVAAKSAAYNAAQVKGEFNHVAMKAEDAKAIIDRAAQLQPAALFNKYASQESGFKPEPASAPAAPRRPAYARAARLAA